VVVGAPRVGESFEGDLGDSPSDTLVEVEVPGRRKLGQPLVTQYVHRNLAKRLGGTPRWPIPR